MAGLRLRTLSPRRLNEVNTGAVGVVWGEARVTRSIGVWLASRSGPVVDCISSRNDGGHRSHGRSLVNGGFSTTPSPASALFRHVCRFALLVVLG